MTANGEKMKMKKPYAILVSPTDFLKNLSPTQFFWNFILPCKKGLGRGRKLMCFYLKIYVILFNSFCVFLLELMFLKVFTAAGHKT